MKSIMLGLAFFGIIFLIVCDNGVKPTSQQQKVSELKLTNEVTSWTEDATVYKAFNPTNINDMIDGNCVIYINAGLVEGIRQEFINTTVTTATLRITIDVEDFSTATKAQNIFNTITSTTILDTVKIDGYDSTVVLGSNNPGGKELVLFAHFNKFYFELKFSKYGDATVNSLVTEGKRFLSVYQSKITSNFKK